VFQGHNARINKLGRLNQRITANSCSNVKGPTRTWVIPDVKWTGETGGGRNECKNHRRIEAIIHSEFFPICDAVASEDQTGRSDGGHHSFTITATRATSKTIAIVARFADIEDAVAASLRVTGRRATIATDSVATVAILADLDDVVTALRELA